MTRPRIAVQLEYAEKVVSLPPTEWVQKQIALLIEQNEREMAVNCILFMLAPPGEETEGPKEAFRELSLNYYSELIGEIWDEGYAAGMGAADGE